MSTVPPFMLATAIAGLTCPPVVYLSWKRREKRGAVSLGSLMACAFLWITVNLTAMAVFQFSVGIPWVDVVTNRYQASLSWQRFAYFGITTTVLSWFVFSAEYTARDELTTSRTLALLSIEPIAINVLIWTKPDLVWAETLATPSTATGVTITQYGIAFWVHAVYSYLLIFAGAYFLVGMLYHSQRIYQTQAVAVLTASVAPLVGNLLYLSGTVSTDLTPAGFAVFGTGFAFAVFRYDVMNLAPVARSTVVDNIEEGVIVLDEEDRIVDINSACSRWLGVENEAVVGEPVHDVLSDYPELVNRFDDVVEDHDEVTVETDDGPRHFQVRISPVNEETDRRYGRLFLIHDVTRQKRRQRELQRQNEQLDQFASMVSHDLQNPLGRAQSRLEIVRRESDSDHVDQIASAHEEMDELIDDLLTLAQQGRQIGETTPVSLETVARAALSVLDDEPKVEFEDDLYTIEADPGRVQQLFENLFRNSIEHGHSGTTVRIGTLQDRPGFYVADDGPGIPKAERDKVFESGYTRSDTGTGIGLTIVETVVSAHGWKVTIAESAEGGARFEITTGGSVLSNQDGEGDAGA